MLKKIITKVLKPVYNASPKGIKRVYYKLKGSKKIDETEVLNHLVKQDLIRELRAKYNSNTLVETGTYLGDMVQAQLNNFKTIYSIELDKYLWKQAVKRFEKHDHVHILKGDSGKVLNEIVPKLTEQSMFWLDGHYSGGITAKGDKNSPIFEELTAIFSSDLKHIILIDDARCFNGTLDYPTYEALCEFVNAKRPGSIVSVRKDIIVVE